jgi:hypothetical protein
MPGVVTKEQLDQERVRVLTLDFDEPTERQRGKIANFALLYGGDIRCIRCGRAANRHLSSGWQSDGGVWTCPSCDLELHATRELLGRTAWDWILGDFLS